MKKISTNVFIFPPFEADAFSISSAEGVKHFSPFLKIITPYTYFLFLRVATQCTTATICIHALQHLSAYGFVSSPEQYIGNS